jgi:hypothetical protein
MGKCKNSKMQVNHRNAREDQIIRARRHVSLPQLPLLGSQQGFFGFTAWFYVIHIAFGFTLLLIIALDHCLRSPSEHLTHDLTDRRNKLNLTRGLVSGAGTELVFALDIQGAPMYLYLWTSQPQQFQAFPAKSYLDNM